MIARIAVFLFIYFTVSDISAQLTKEDIKELLIIQGRTETETLDREASEIHASYITRISYNTDDLPGAVLSSIGSGAAMGLFQSRSADYENFKWMPGFMQDWYNYLPKDEAVLARLDTWQKDFREADYILSRSAYNDWNRYFGGAWYYAYPVHWAVKNLSASLMRHKMKYGNFF